MTTPSLRSRLHAALTAYRDPVPTAPGDVPSVPRDADAHPEPEVSLAPHLRAVALYDHWHPRGRTLFGWLHVTRSGGQVVGFTPYDDRGYGVTTTALHLQRLLATDERTAVPVARWQHGASGREYWVLGEAVAQASTRPIQDDDRIWIYENAEGQWFIRRPEEFLDGRFQPANALAEQALAGRPTQDEAQPITPERLVLEAVRRAAYRVADHITEFGTVTDPELWEELQAALDAAAPPLQAPLVEQYPELLPAAAALLHLTRFLLACHVLDGLESVEGPALTLALQEEEAAQVALLHDLPAPRIAALQAAAACLMGTAPQPPEPLEGRALTETALVAAFAPAMAEKLARARAKGRGGWEDPAACTVTHLWDCLHGHVFKANLDMVDVGNLAAMIWWRLQHVPGDREALEGHVASLPTPPANDRARLQAILDGPRLSDLTHDQLLDHVADQVASSQRLAGVETAPGQIRAYLDDHSAMQEKAALWDALLGSARLRLLGWADPMPTGYAHFSLEAWTVYPGHDFTESNRRAREVITAYAQAAMRRRDASPSTSSSICGTSNLKDGLQCGVTPQDEQKG